MHKGFQRRIFDAHEAQETALCERQAFINPRAPTILTAGIHMQASPGHVKGWLSCMESKALVKLAATLPDDLRRALRQAGAFGRAGGRV